MITNDIVGKYVTLRSATEADAEFALAVRQTPGALKFMPPLNVNMDQQRAWINKQHSMEGDYFFVVFNRNDERVGVIGLFDMHDGECEIGRLVMQGTAIDTIEAHLLVLRFAFGDLKLKKVVGYIYPDNDSALRLSKMFDAEMGKPALGSIKTFDCLSASYYPDKFVETEKKIVKLIYRRR